MLNFQDALSNDSSKVKKHAQYNKKIQEFYLKTMGADQRISTSQDDSSQLYLKTKNSLEKSDSNNYLLMAKSNALDAKVKNVKAVLQGCGAGSDEDFSRSPRKSRTFSQTAVP